MSDENTLYRHYDANDVAIYYGISRDNGTRQSYHDLYSIWVPFSVRRTEEVFDSREGAVRAERAAIQQDEPIFNKMHNTAGQHERMIRYLVEHDRLDLLQLDERKPARSRDAREDEDIWEFIRSRPLCQDGVSRMYEGFSGGGYAMTDGQAYIQYKMRSVELGLAHRLGLT